MKIIKNSIKILNAKNAPFYNLAREMSRTAIIDITVRNFTYQATLLKPISFSMSHLKNIFFDDLKTMKNIKGAIQNATYKESQDIILSCFSNNNLSFSTNDAEEFFKDFLQEISNNFTLPPTHTYQHLADPWSTFSGIYWYFCFIYLNDTTKDGIVIAASAWD